MLLLISIFCGIICSSWGQEDKINVLVPIAQTGELRQQAEICGKEHGVDPNDIRKMLTWNFPNEKAHKQFLFCLCFNSGYIDKDGHYKMDKMLKVIPLSGTQEDYINYIENCNKVTLENNLETTYEMLACFHRHYIPTVTPTKQ